MSLAARSAHPPRKNVKEQCTVCLLTESLPDDEREALEAMFASHLWSGAAIARALGEEGLGRFSDNTIRRHRRKECFRESYTEAG
jgi:hypothetical protein